MSEYIAVIPCGRWVYWESANLRGSPAVHAVNSDNPERTLCGKDPDGWTPYTKRGVGFRSMPKIDCKVCVRVMKKNEIPQHSNS